MRASPAIPPAATALAIRYLAESCPNRNDAPGNASSRLA